MSIENPSHPCGAHEDVVGHEPDPDRDTEAYKELGSDGYGPFTNGELDPEHQGKVDKIDPVG